MALIEFLIRLVCDDEFLTIPDLTGISMLMMIPSVCFTSVGIPISQHTSSDSQVASWRTTGKLLART